MSNVGLVIEERAAQIGNFLVGRLLPFRQKRSVGPFVFIDHMGPARLSTEEQFDVDPHPHIGLSTLTYLLEGSIMHRDSMGTEIEIQPGAVNWMTAGSGVVHSERTPDYLRNQEKHVHGLQIWIALPKDQEEIAPNFTHIEKDQLPVWEESGIHFRLIAGEAYGRKAPVPVYSPLFLVEIVVTKDCEITIPEELVGEKAVYVLNGSISIENQLFGEKLLLVHDDASLCTIRVNAGTQLYLFGGQPFPEPRYIDWNFVSSSQERIQQAIKQWEAHEFPPMKNDTGYVPYPPKMK